MSRINVVGLVELFLLMIMVMVSHSWEIMRRGRYSISTLKRLEVITQKISLGRSTRLYQQASSLTTSFEKKRIVFLGTPGVAAQCLGILHNASLSNNATVPFEIISVVSQPPAPAGRNKKLTKSPVHDYCEKVSLPILTPENAKDVQFLEHLEGMKIDLFVTAAYGNYLPKRFLNIAKYGTINIHPSLLPKYRGAAPVQRCLENGDPMTGVTLLYSVMKMDAGPILKQVLYPLKGHEKSTQVLEDCFRIGSNALVDILPNVFSGQAQTTIQDESQATSAPKLNVTDGLIDFSTMSAIKIHNKCRGFADWPGTYAYFVVNPVEGAKNEAQRIKIVTTIVTESNSNYNIKADNTVSAGKVNGKDVLLITCGDGSKIGIYEMQPAGKKVMDAKSFLNGLRGNLNMSWTLPPVNRKE